MNDPVKKQSYKFGFSDPDVSVFRADKGLSTRVVEQISHAKSEPGWMREFRLRSLEVFEKKPVPPWGADLSGIDFDEIFYYVRPSDHPVRSWEDVPQSIRDTYERIGVPQAERKFLAGVKAQYDSEVIYGSLREELSKQGIVFLSMDEALVKHPEIVKEYFGTLIPPADNKFAALNSAVWSGGSFVYIPAGVKVDLPLQAYFRINAQNMGQFERTLIVAEEGSFVHYVEGCFTKGTLITSNPEYKPIEEVRKGDRVLTHNGGYKTVYHTQVRPYSGDLYSLEFYGDSSQKLEATEEHPFLTAPRERRNERNRDFELGWKPVRDLQRMDYLAMPINKVVKSFPSHQFEIVMGGGRWRKPQKIKKEVKLSPEFFRLAGYYLAEGSISSGYYLNFSFSSHERDYIDDVKGLVKSVFGTDRFHESVHKKNSGISVVIRSAELARIFSQFGTSSSTKKIPNWMMVEDPKRQKELIVGLFRGDGNYYNRKHRHGRKELFRISSTSPVLIRQSRDILLRLGVVGFINKRDRSKEGRQAMYTLGVGGEFMVPFGDLVGVPIEAEINGHKRATLFAIDDEYAYFPIKKIVRRKVKSLPVYNFSVRGDESYLVSGVAAHNCTAPNYTTNSLHAAVVEIIVKKGARVRYTTIQNWSKNVYNLVTKRAWVGEDAVMEWVDGNLGSRVTMKYPSVYLMGKGARGEVLSLAYAEEGQHQ
ncbi:MAG: SufD family Fe-S cluster assembly protein, partial [bacterium]|nr:SufD family Fe-S cluster assembly protein [bacterium]